MGVLNGCRVKSSPPTTIPRYEGLVDDIYEVNLLSRGTRGLTDIYTLYDHYTLYSHNTLLCLQDVLLCLIISNAKGYTFYVTYTLFNMKTISLIHGTIFSKKSTARQNDVFDIFYHFHDVFISNASDTLFM